MFEEQSKKGMWDSNIWLYILSDKVLLKISRHKHTHTIYIHINSKVKVKSLSRVQLFVTPWTVAYQVPPSMGFSRQEFWSGLPFSSPGDLPNPGIESMSPALQADSLLSEPPGKPIICLRGSFIFCNKRSQNISGLNKTDFYLSFIQKSQR